MTKTTKTKPTLLNQAAATMKDLATIGEAIRAIDLAASAWVTGEAHAATMVALHAILPLLG